MPILHVPLSRKQSSPNDSTSTVSISYRILGDGPVLVLLVPGLCVPASMYDSMAAVLAATSQFTSVLIDNRGIGDSEIPPANILGGAGYTISEFAADAWSVVDDVLERGVVVKDGSDSDEGLDDGNTSWSSKRRRRRVRKEIALVGHSMGGMIVQEMLVQRPRQVRFVGLLSTHAGGVWNLLPTSLMMKGVAKVLWSGFDRDVHAAVNLSLHFTQRFLDSWVVPELDFQMVGEWVEGGKKGNEKEGGTGESEGEAEAEAEAEEGEGKTEKVGDERNEGNEEDVAERMDESASEEKDEDGEESGASMEPKSSSDSEVLNECGSCEAKAGETERSCATKLVEGIGFFESKVVELVRDAQVYFGFSSKSVRSSLWKPQKALIDAIMKRRRCRRRRWDIYHARYTGTDVDTQMTSSTSGSSDCSKQNDSADTMYGHAAVVRSHGLQRAMAAKLKACTRVVKLVMLGRHDQVVTPGSSRRLANMIGANTVVEVEAAHFITDEAAAEVTTHVIYGLRKAFYAGGGACDCEWCTESVDAAENAACRMC